MKRLSSILLVIAMTLGAGSAFAQSIDVVADPAGGSCQANFAIGAPTNIWIIARLGGEVATGISTAEFRITGLPATWLTILTPHANATVSLGDPFKAPGGGAPHRANIGFGSCEAGSNGIVLMYTVTVIAFTAEQAILQVEVPDVPTNPGFTTPILTACDAQFSAHPALGGQFYVNQTGCEVAVEDQAWGEVKALFR